MRTIEATATVSPDGTLTVRVSTDVPPGEHRVVLVIDGDVQDERAQEWSDLLHTATSSLDFWDNPYDDEDWNDAGRLQLHHHLG